MFSDNFLYRHAKLLIFGVLILLAGLAVFRHKTIKPTSNYEKFSGYVESYTTGIISRHSTIRIRLANDVQTIHTQDEAINGEVFSFQPKVAGKAFWIDSRTIEFRPDQELEASRSYSVTADLSRILSLPESLSSFRFDFETIKPAFSITFDGLRSSSASAANPMYLPGTLVTSDEEKPALIEKVIQAEYQHAVKIRWKHDPSSHKHIFTIDSIKRFDAPQFLKVIYTGKSLGFKNSPGEQQFEIPAFGQFKVLGVKTIQDEEQYVSVLFSDPIRIGQELDGLIGISTTEMPAYTINGNEIKLYPSTRLDGNYTVFVNAGIENFEGRKLPKTISANVIFQNTEPAVTIPGKGVILPHSGKLLMPFEAINLNAVDVTILKIYGNNIPQYLQDNSMDGDNQLRQVAKPVKQITIRLDADGSINLHKKHRFMLDIDRLLRTEPGAIYRIVIGFRPSYSIYPCKDEDFSAEENTDEDEYYEDGYSGIDEDDEFWKRYDNYYPYGYNWEERKNPCNSSFYNKERWASRNVLASNIGLIAKQSSDFTYTIATTDILTAEPMGGVDLELLDYQKQVVGRGKTSDEGLTQIKAKRKPYLLLAKKGKERAYLKIDDASSLPLSRFNVGGAQVQKGLKGFIYGERGVWRPGDSLFLTFILDDKKNKLPKGHPIDLELYTPQGQLFKSLSTSQSLNGFYSFKVSTEPGSPTGNWTARVKAGGARFEKRIRIETIMPNRLKINLSFKGTKELVKSRGIKGTLHAEWLVGAAANGLNAKIDAFVSSEPTTFKGFEKYMFDDPVRPFASQLQNVFDGNLDQNGYRDFDASINIDQQAPGRLMTNFMVKVFEPGGNFSINQTSIPYHVYSGYVGIRTPEGATSSDMLVTDKNHIIDIVSVDVDGKLQRGNRKIAVELYKVKWRWWWDEEASSVANFTQDELNRLIETTTIETTNGRGKWNLRINQPEWGRYLIRVRDIETGHSTGKFIYVDWPNWAERLQNENPSEAAMLSFTANKEKYKIGEEAILTIPSTSVGRGLLSIENGSSVLETHWFEARKGQTQVRFKITKEMTPNVFLNVTLLQPHSQTVNDLPLRMYGLIPIEIENPSTILKPVINMATEIKPETKTSLTVHEANGKPMSYTIAIVDEGLLDISGFSTPDPHSTFYAREGLGIKTWDLFDYVIGAYGGDLQRILSIGGDRQSGKNGKNPVANRFKPVVKFLGPFYTNGSKKTHSFTLPQYVGSVKVMLIAGQDGAYGLSDKTVKVKKPLMVLATMPRVLSPGEQLRLPMTVFAMDKSIKDVSVQVQSSAFNFISGNTRNISFAKPSEQMVYLDLKTKNFSGIARLQVLVKSGKETAKHTIELNVRNPSPVLTKITEKTVAGGSSVSIPFTAFGSSGSRKATLEISSIPPINLAKRLGYLLQYPHGCLEQITSGAFPQLYLSQLTDLSDKQQAETDKNIKSAINQLKAFQLPDGGMAYWPGAGEAEEWSTNYSGHFMLEAEAKGYVLPSGFISNWKKFQKLKAVAWSPKTTDFYGSDLLQAYRLYLLALSKSPETGAMNRLKEFKYLSPAAKWRLAAAYRLAGQREIAIQLIRGLPLTVPAYKQSYGTFGSDMRDEAMILETLVLMDQQQAASKMLVKITSKLAMENWYSTQSTAYALIAVSKYCGALPSAQKINVSYKVNSVGGKLTSNSVLSQLNLKLNPLDNLVSVSNSGKNKLFIRLINQGQPLIGQDIPAIESNSLSIRTGYFSLKGDLLDPTKLAQGTDFIAQVTIKNPGKNGDYTNLALTHLIPSGWEIINTRLSDNEDVFQPSPSDYKDIRDDRVNTYFSLQAGKEATYFVLLNASYAGRFYLPPSTCEAMYDGTIRASSAGKWIDVIPAVSAKILAGTE